MSRADTAGLRIQCLLAPADPVTRHEPAARAAGPVDSSTPAELEPYDFYRATAVPWLRLNFISSLDGLITDRRGRAGGLGGAGDLEAFRAQRALADVILVGAGTARVEGYGPYRPPPALAARRAADGRPAPAPIAVVSRSLDLDPDTALFAEARTPTIVVTCAASPERRRAELARAADVVVAGDDDVDLAGALAQLHARGLPSVLCEGGPALATALLAAGLVDELCLTIAPQIVGLEGKRLVQDTTELLAERAELIALGRVGDELFTRYRIVPPRAVP